MVASAYPRWALQTLLLSGAILIPAVSLLLLWLFTKGLQPDRLWAARASFFVETMWLFLFAGTALHVTKTLGGIGLEHSTYAVIFLITLQAVVAGLVGFNAAWKLAAVVPLFVGLYAVLPYLLKISSRSV